MDEAARQLRRIVQMLVRKLGLLQKSEAACCGITLGQCHALVELNEAAYMTLNELAERLNVDKSTVSRTVDGLVGAGLAERTSDSADRRYVRIALTERGRQLAARINRSMDGYFRRLLDTVPPDRRDRVAGGIADLLAAVQRSGIFYPDPEGCCTDSTITKESECCE